MTVLLDKAIQEVSKLPPEQQNAIATIILDEIADEQWWNEAFARSQNQLANLAKKVRKDIKTGRTKKMGFDEL